MPASIDCLLHPCVSHTSLSVLPNAPSIRLTPRAYISLEKLENEETNFKSRIIEWAQKEKRDLVFEIVNEVGEGRNKVFEACVKLDGEEITRGKEKSKKKAEQKAAEQFCKKFNVLNE